ncbi:MAG: hypothetical protein V3S55_15540 [Nitrospiraceae bacterium]
MGFKCDIEQSAEVIEVKKSRDWQGRAQVTYVVKAGPDGFSGQYIGRDDTYEIDSRDCFDDED